MQPPRSPTPPNATAPWLWHLRIARVAPLLLIFLASNHLRSEETPRPLDPHLFPLPHALSVSFDFWTDIFSVYSSRQVILHDEQRLDLVYEVLDFTELETSETSDERKELERRRRVREAEKRIRTALYAMSAGRPGYPVQLAVKLGEMFADVPGGRSRYRIAAQRLRSQSGLRDHFEDGIRRSGRYLPAVEELFRRRGLPVELTRLPFVESMFQETARSRAAAGGIWQIIPSTGRRLLHIGYEVDERYDPLISSEAAATLLAENYAALGTWPLAITAYNHGKNGMVYATRRLDTKDIGVIITHHHSRTFGFASRNFYVEFLAAATIYENRDALFPGVEPEPRLSFEELTPDRFVPALELAERTGVALQLLRELNPALNPDVWRGRLLLPKGYPLRVPAGTGEIFRDRYADMPDSLKPQHQVGQRYRVRRGDTLIRIAQRFGTSVESLQRANGIRHPDRIHSGQLLHIPPDQQWRSAASSQASIHVVGPGDTLYSIARQFRTTVQALVETNRLPDSDRIYVGQRLSIPTSVAR